MRKFVSRIAVFVAALVLSTTAYARSCTDQAGRSLKACEVNQGNKSLKRRMDCPYETDKRLKECLQTGLWSTKAMAGKTFEKQ